MIYYLCLKGHRYTVEGWLRKYSGSQRGQFKVFGYRQLGELSGPATIIFTDFDRLPSEVRAEAGEHCELLEKAGYRVLNHPGKSLLRYDLQKVLNNDFSVYREDELPSCRFPVFLRAEYGHVGSETGLLRDQQELSEAESKYPGSLAIEFLDTSDSQGVFRKYSAFCIGEKIVPKHILFSKHWEVKSPDIVDQKTLAEEVGFIQKNPHQRELSKIFKLANIQYGRIDYSFLDNRIQVWEINTNPMLNVPENTKHETRSEVHEMSASLINQAFLALDSAVNVA